MLIRRFVVAFAAALCAAAPASARSVAVGAYADGCPGLVPFAAWLGKPTASVYNLHYLTPHDSAQINSEIRGAICAPGQNLELSLSIGTQNATGSLDTYANMIDGFDDPLYKDVASALATYAPHAIVRLGWEMNGNWFDWGVQSGAAYGFTAAQYIAVYQHFVKVMRSVPGTSGLKFDWAPDLCPGCTDAQTLYPGNGYVDIIGIDAYETQTGDGTAAGWASDWVNCFRCLAWQVSFAKSHGKALAIDEWGIGYPHNSLDDNDAPGIIQQMGSWLNNTGNANGYEPYRYFISWNTNEAYCGVISGEPNGPCPGGYAPTTHGPSYQLPKSAAAFLATFRAVSSTSRKRSPRTFERGD